MWADIVVPGLDGKDVEVLILFGPVFLEILEEMLNEPKLALAFARSCIISVRHNYKECVIVPELSAPRLNRVRSGGCSQLIIG